MNKKNRLMMKEYGIGSGQCGHCCNCHFSEKSRNQHICIAYGEVEGEDCTWDIYSMACGLFNKPFLGLKPKRMPLAEFHKHRQETAEEDSSQISLFG